MYKEREHIRTNVEHTLASPWKAVRLVDACIVAVIVSALLVSSVATSSDTTTLEIHATWTGIVNRLAAMPHERRDKVLLVELDVEELAYGIEKYPQPNLTEVVGETTVLAGTASTSPRFFVRTCIWVKPDGRVVLAWPQEAPVHQLWLRPGDKILALAVRLNREPESRGDLPDWYREDDWWEILAAAQVDGDTLRIVEEAAFDPTWELPEATVEASRSSMRRRMGPPLDYRRFVRAAESEIRGLAVEEAVR